MKQVNVRLDDIDVKNMETIKETMGTFPYKVKITNSIAIKIALQEYAAFCKNNKMT